MRAGIGAHCEWRHDVMSCVNFVKGNRQQAGRLILGARGAPFRAADSLEGALLPTIRPVCAVYDLQLAPLRVGPLQLTDIVLAFFGLAQWPTTPTPKRSWSSLTKRLTA